jgi:serine/threonine-protein kinase
MASYSVGDVIAGYRLDAPAGRGGMGVVFRATHIALERQGAVKLIAPALAADDDFRQRFRRESRLAASIDHPHVIPVFDAGEEDGQLYVAMRYVEGTDLAQLIASRGAVDASEAVPLIAQVADALDAAHERGLVHRDVKPANVLIETRPTGPHAYLTDFGLVKTVGATSGVLTRTGNFLGTPDYAAPEQVRGEGVDARTDVYALGCMLFHAVVGRPPYVRDNDVAKLFAHMNDPAPSLAEARGGIPPGLDEVVRKALAKDPEDRYARASDLAAAAQAALTPTQVADRPAPVTEVRSRPAADVHSPPAPANNKRGRWVLAAAAVALLACIAVLAVALGGGDGGGDDGGSAATIPDGNLTGNPSFEENTEGWDFFESSITREQASDAPFGDHVARVTLTGQPGEYSIDDDPETVSSSRAGTTYTASAWVKATPANDGKPICISLREGLEESDGAGPFTAASVTASAGEYQQVRVSHRAAESGKSIGVHVFRAGAGMSEGEAFLVDGIALTEGGGAAAQSAAECDA